jgi:alpha-galactosidase
LQQDLVSGTEAANQIGVAEMKGVQARQEDIAAARQNKMDWPANAFVSTQPQFDLLSLRGPLHLPANAEPPETEQARLATLALWDPYVGAIVRNTDAYSFRSAALWQAVTSYDTRQSGMPYGAMQEFFHEWRVVSPFFVGDYYPLVAGSGVGNGWQGWQFNDPRKGLGMLQAFRSTPNVGTTVNVKLRGIDADATYQLTDVDQNKTVSLTGAQLLQDGYTINTTAQERAPLIEYGKVQP